MIHFLEISHAAQMAHLHESAFYAPWSETDFSAHVENPMDDVVGWVGDDGLQGFIVMRTQDDQAEVLTLVVMSEVQGRGVGAKILAAGEQAVLARGADIVFLDVAADTPAAIHLYKKTGYYRCGTRKGYYRRAKGRVDAFLFSKKIPG